MLDDVASLQATLEASEGLRRKAEQCILSARLANSAGQVQAAKEQVVHGKRCLEEALARCPSNHRARFLLVSVAMNENDFQLALAQGLRIYRDLDRKQTLMNDSVLHLGIAHAYQKLGQREEAIRMAKEASELYQNDPQPCMVLAELMEDKDARIAEEYCRIARERNESQSCCRHLSTENTVFLFCCLGSCLVRQNRFAEAELEFCKALDIDSKDLQPRRHLVDLHERAGRVEDALRELQELQKISPLDQWTQQHAARLEQLRRKQREEARRQRQSNKFYTMYEPEREESNWMPPLTARGARDEAREVLSTPGLAQHASTVSFPECHDTAIHWVVTVSDLDKAVGSGHSNGFTSSAGDEEDEAADCHSNWTRDCFLACDG